MGQAWNRNVVRPARTPFFHGIAIAANPFSLTNTFSHAIPKNKIAKQTSQPRGLSPLLDRPLRRPSNLDRLRDPLHLDLQADMACHRGRRIGIEHGECDRIHSV